MIYFVSGHMDLSFEDFMKYYTPVLLDIFSYDAYPIFVVGDCKGVDKFSMDYIYNNMRCGELHIYHMFDSPRNKPERHIEEGYNLIDEYDWVDRGDSVEIQFIGGFQSDEERDSAMTQNSDCDIAFIKDNRWNSGTAKNIKRRHSII